MTSTHIPVSSDIAAMADLAGYAVTRRGSMFYICDYIHLMIVPVYDATRLKELNDVLENSCAYEDILSKEVYEHALADLRMWVHDYVHDHT